MRDLIDQIDRIEEAKAHYTQAKLPYNKQDLVPVMSKDTLDYHYGKLYKGYVDKANKGEGGDFQIAGAFLHSLYFPQFKKPSGSNKPTGVCAELIKDFDKFKDDFTKTAMGIQGSGWIYMDTSGAIKTIKNHKVVKNIALLVDWWEHAWALDYQSDKNKYLLNTWKIINWNIINDRIINAN